jgi:hypothetical protein
MASQAHTITIPVPQEMMRNMLRIMAQVSQFQQAAIDSARFARTVNQQYTQAVNVQNTLMVRFRRMQQLLNNTRTQFQANTARIMQAMGPFGGAFLRALTIPATIIRFTAVMGASAIAAIPGLTKWIWDQMVHLGDSILQDWLEASGLVSSIGGLRAYRYAFGSLPNDPALAGNVATGRTDITSQQLLALKTLGVKQTSDTADMMVQATLAAAQFMKTNDLYMSLAKAAAMGITSLFTPESLLALRNMDIKELQRRRDLYEANKQKLDISKKAREAWISFSVQIDKMWAHIDTIIGEKLANPKSPIVQLITRLAKRIEDFVAWIAEQPITKTIIDKIEIWLIDFTNWMKEGKLVNLINQLAELALQFTQSVIKASDELRKLGRHLSGDSATFERSVAPGGTPSPTSSGGYNVSGGGYAGAPSIGGGGYPGSARYALGGPPAWRQPVGGNNGRPVATGAPSSSAGATPKLGGGWPTSDTPAGRGMALSSRGRGGQSNKGNVSNVGQDEAPSTDSYNSLADMRAGFAKEMKDNPQLRQRLLAQVEAEVGGQPALTRQAYFEQIMNRAANRHQTLARALNDTAYFPPRTQNITNSPGYLERNVSAEGIAARNAELNAVLAGSDVSRGGTGNYSVYKSWGPSTVGQTGVAGLGGGTTTFVSGAPYSNREYIGMEKTDLDLGWLSKYRKATAGGGQQQFPSTPSTPTNRLLPWPGEEGKSSTPSTGGNRVISPFTTGNDFRIGTGNVFGAGRPGGRPHSGNDLHAGPPGTSNGQPVVSMTGGTVLYRGVNRGYNANIVIQGDDGIIRRYAPHASTAPLAVGSRVTQGQIIGVIGEDHLHYEEIPPTIGGRPNPVYQQFVDNAPTNTFTSTSYQKGVVNPSGPEGSLQYIGKGDRVVSPVMSQPTDRTTQPAQLDAGGKSWKYERRAGESGEFNYAATGAYGPPGQNLTTIQLNSGRSVQVNKEVAPRYQGFLNELEGRGYRINSLGGYDYRTKVGGGSGLSMHAYGAAIDINPGQNTQYGQTTNMPKDIEQLAWKHGLSWGGRFGDPMHFEPMSDEAWASKRKQMEQTGTLPLDSQRAPSLVPGQTPASTIRDPAWDEPAWMKPYLLHKPDQQYSEETKTDNTVEVKNHGSPETPQKEPQHNGGSLKEGVKVDNRSDHDIDVKSSGEDNHSDD